MVFSVQDRLIQMCDAPSLRDIVLEKLQQFLRSLSCDVVSPGTERNQKLSVLVKWQIAIQRVGPYTVFVAVLPLIASGCDRIIFVIYQNRFDPGRSELYSKCCFVI